MQYHRRQTKTPLGNLRIPAEFGTCLFDMSVAPIALMPQVLFHKHLQSRLKKKIASIFEAIKTRGNVLKN